MKAARIIAAGRPLEIAETPDRSVQAGEIRIRVRATGVCHSDLHLWEGGYDMGDGKVLKVTDRGVSFPVTPGHEVAGTVEELGEGAGGFAIGDEVLVYPWAGCGSCPACEKGMENVCDAPRSMGIFQDGGYAETMTVPSQKYLARIDGVGMDEATSLACSGLTAYTAVKRAAESKPKNIVIIGAGGLGLMGVQIAHAITEANIVCVDLDDTKLETAREMGAAHTVNSSGEGVAQRVIDACGGTGAESVIDFVNAPPTAGLALEVVRKRGNIVMVGLFGGILPLTLVSIPLRAITIQGAYTGTYDDMVELIGLARSGAIKPMVSRRYSLDDANTALSDLKARKIVGRAVINP